MHNSVSEEEFLRVTSNIIHQFSSSYKFGLYSEEDIAQEIYLECWNKLSKWDGERDLQSFLVIIVRNYLNNLKRDKWYRPECVCKLCHNKSDGETGHRDKKYCEAFLEWKSRNARKANLAAPQSIPNNFDMHDDVEPDNFIVTDELNRIIDSNMPVSLRKIYVQMKSGMKVNNVDKGKVLKYIRKLFKKYG